ncbi:bifunctional hydroxymethylpyrimidine kinase/phosphomethylpyrimidine kinase [Aquincola tertiaricarbonis]|uniref:bifunctional hydroxymethylpyrimidine kinase/phosphomethylpyrimidine kinase n=1 Tax=Aquincola tertiaricarbonis TaxID=391953 RepID=UPI00061529D2|nr:bifunctional hydroxymethylpyrimidine kinase/phosphomethylpyrimidine kinase [Aquincola tertiaricarbonis]
MTTESAAPACRYARVLTIAGSDSGGGAGIQADLKTFAALGCYGSSAITAITAQNTLGVRAIHAVPTEVLAAQIDAVAEDIGCDAVKIGMLHSAATVQCVAAAIDRHGLRPVVLDPVMIATSGAALIDAAAVQVIVQALFPRVALVTPNLDEAALLLGRAIVSVDELDGAADALLELGAQAVLLKGGHLPGDTVVDVLKSREGLHRRFQAPRLHSRNLHGTGCTLSAAVAAALALGQPMADAVAAAHAYVQQALRHGAAVRTGAGNGPLNHGHAPRPMQLRPLAGEGRAA